MKNQIINTSKIILLIVTLSSFTMLTRPHLVGTVVLNGVGEKVELKATLDKTILAYAARKEGDCSTSELMKKCGSAYFLKHLKVQVNGKNVKFAMKNMELAGDKVILLFEAIQINEEIKSVRVSSNYFQEFNDGSQTNVVMNINSQKRVFNLDQHQLSAFTAFGTGTI